MPVLNVRGTRTTINRCPFIDSCRHTVKGCLNHSSKTVNVVLNLRLCTSPLRNVPCFIDAHLVCLENPQMFLLGRNSEVCVAFHASEVAVPALAKSQNQLFNHNLAELLTCDFAMGCYVGNWPRRY